MITTLFLIALCQIILYWLAHKYDKDAAKPLILFLLILAYIFWIPQFFYPKVIEGRHNCGLPMMAAHLVIGILGSIGSFLVYIFYPFLEKK